MLCLRPSGSIYCSDSSVAFRLLAFRKNVCFGIVLWSSFKFDASPTYDSVVVTVVRLQAFETIKPFCFLPAVAARVMILVWGCYYI